MTSTPAYSRVRVSSPEKEKTGTAIVLLFSPVAFATRLSLSRYAYSYAVVIVAGVVPGCRRRSARLTCGTSPVHDQCDPRHYHSTEHSTTARIWQDSGQHITWTEEWSTAREQGQGIR